LHAVCACDLEIFKHFPGVHREAFGMVLLVALLTILGAGFRLPPRLTVAVVRLPIRLRLPFCLWRNRLTYLGLTRLPRAAVFVEEATLEVFRLPFAALGHATSFHFPVLLLYRTLGVLSCVADRSRPTVPMIPNKPCVVGRRPDLARKPHDAVKQHDLLSEERTVAEQTSSGLADVEVGAQQHGDHRCNSIACAMN
jgi:hypothetical protein